MLLMQDKLLNKALLVACIAYFGSVEGSEEEKIKYAVVSQVVSAHEVFTKQSLDYDVRVAKPLCETHIARARLFELEQVDRVRINAELLAAVVAVFRPVYRTVISQLAKIEAMEDAVCLSVSDTGYQDVATVKCFYVSEENDEMPRIIFASFQPGKLESCFGIPSLAYTRIQALLWHELGHLRLQHTPRRIAYKSILEGHLDCMANVAAQAWSLSMYEALSEDIKLRAAAGGIIFLNYKMMFSFLLQSTMLPLVMAKRRKQNEHEADAWSLRYDASMQYHTIAALVIENFRWQLAQQEDLLHTKPLLLRIFKRTQKSYDAVFASHPTPQQRIRALVERGILHCHSSHEIDTYKKQVKEVIGRAADRLLEMRYSTPLLNSEEVENRILRDSLFLCSAIDRMQPPQKHRCTLL